VGVRKAREIESFGTYYILQRSSNESHLFNNDADRAYFLKILGTTKRKFNFKLIAFCVRNEDMYHLIIDTNGSDLSNIMKSINIAYAMYANCKGKLFKDRYFSEALRSESEIIEKISETTKMQEGISPFSGHCCLVSGQVEPPISEEANPLCDGVISIRESPCRDCIQTLDEAKLKLLNIASDRKCTVDDIFKDKKERDALILNFRQNSTLSLKNLGLLFGGLSESSICKILKDKC